MTTSPETQPAIITESVASRGRKTFTVYAWTCACGNAAQAPDRSHVERTAAAHQCRLAVR